MNTGVTDFVHIGLVVEDLDETVRFLALLGLDCGKPGVFSGEWIDRIIGLENVKVELVIARAPTAATCSRWCASTRRPRALKRRRRPRTVLGSGTSPSRSMTCAASSTASGRPAGKPPGRSSTSRTPSFSATSADPKG